MTSNRNYSNIVHERRALLMVHKMVKSKANGTSIRDWLEMLGWLGFDFVAAGQLMSCKKIILAGKIYYSWWDFLV